jgi:hypothetical protein
MQFGDARALAQEATALVVAAGRQALAARGRFSFALSPAFVTPHFLDALAATAERERATWAGTHVFLADTAFTSAQYPGPSLAGVLAARLPLGERQLHFGAAATRDAVRAARAYECELRTFFRLAGGDVPRFDLVAFVLDSAGRVGGLGAHGVASEQVTRLAIAEFAADRRAQVVTLTAPVFAAAAQTVVRATHPAAVRQAKTLRARPPHTLALLRGSVRFLIEVVNTRAPILASAQKSREFIDVCNH